jgi:Flp pilus assembly protein TadD
MVLREKGSIADAIESARRALSLFPAFYEGYNNLGAALSDNRQFAEAIEAFRTAIELKPDFLEAQLNLGAALAESGDFHEAIATLTSLIARAPNTALAHHHLGYCLRHLGRFDEAACALVRATELDAADARTFLELSAALTLQGKNDEAIIACRRALALDDRCAEAYANLGHALREQGLFEQAIDACRRAISLQPDSAETHANLALTLLLLGNLEEGFPEYEWRTKIGTTHTPQFAHPQWTGGDVSGKTVLLHSEQGLGDTLQFVRYAPLVAARGARVILECQPELACLLKSVQGITTVVSKGEARQQFDLHCPLMSLPFAFGTRLSTIPKNVPYITVDRSLSEQWRDRFNTTPRALRAGLVWAGQPAHVNDRKRSISLSQLAPLNAVNGVQFYSLQKGEAGREAATAPAQMSLIDWTEDLNDFADTAAFISQLDLVISVDTAVVHLAGAINKPVWVLLPFVPDWRWRLDGEDNPWYPSVRLFRQKSHNDWEHVMHQVVDALRDWVKC